MLLLAAALVIGALLALVAAAAGGAFRERSFAEYPPIDASVGPVASAVAVASQVPASVASPPVEPGPGGPTRFGTDTIANVISSNLRLSDLSGRIGGEEFAALLPCSLEEGVIVADRMRQVFENSNIVCDEGPVDTTVSIGVAGGPAGTELEVLLAAADTALYQAKRGGRNRVEAAEELPLSLENWRRKSAGIAGVERSTPATA